MRSKIKRVLSITVSLLMIVTTVICPVYADAAPTLNLTGGTIAKGETISVPVAVSGFENGITSFSFHLIYDKENLEFTKAKINRDNDALEEATVLGNTADDIVGFMTTVPYTGTDPICTFEFTTRENVVNGSYLLRVEKTDEDDAMFLCNEEVIPDESVKVIPAEITVTGGVDKLTDANTVVSGIEKSYEYTGEEIKPVPTVTYDGKALTEGTDYDVAYSDNTAVGTATVTITGTGSYIGTVEKTFEITKRAAEITAPSTSYTKIYGEEAFSLGASVNSGAALSYASDNEQAASVDADGLVTINGAGKATITVSAPETETYMKPADMKITVNVSRAEQTVTGPDNLNVTYGDADFDLGAGISPETGATLSYSSSNDNVVSADSNGKVSVNGVGNAVITVTASEVAGKYNTAEKKIPVTVAARELTVTGITAESKVYDGNTSATLVYPASIDGVKAGDIVTVTAKGAFTDANAGTGKTVNITDIKLGGASAGNYVLAESGNQTTATADITKAGYSGSEDITVKATVPANKAVTGKTIDISEFNLPAGFVDARISSFVISSNEGGLIAGTPVISASGTALMYDTASAANDTTAKITVAIESTNYMDVLTTVTITAKDITLDWSKYFTAKDSVVYGTVKSEMFNKASTAGTAADDAGNSLEGSFEISGAADVPGVSADNIVTVSFTVTSGGDYNGVVLTNSYKIPVTAKEVGLAWSGCDGLVYDGNAKDVTAKATGLVGDDVVTVTVTGGNAVNAGEYTATASGLAGSAADNYKLPVSVTKAYTIEKADYNVTLSADTVSVKEGTESTAFLPTASVKGVGSEQPAGELKFYSDAARSKELTVADVKAFATGDHTVYWSFKTSDANYKDAAKTGSIVIKVVSGDPQNIAISGLDGKTYGDAAFTAVATVTTTGGAVADDHGDITWSSSNTNVAEIDAATGVITIKGAGEATITAKAAKVAGKYAAGEGSAELTIAKKTVSLIWSGNTGLVYDGNAKSVKAEADGLVGNDNCSVTVTGGDAKNAGSYTAKATGLSNENYILPGGEAAECAYSIARADYTAALSADTVSIKEGTESLAFLPAIVTKGAGDEQPAGELRFYRDEARSSELTASDVKALSIGDHTVYWSFNVTDANYIDTARTGTLTITVALGDPQNIAISGLDSKTYGDAAFTATAEVTTTGGADATGHGDITWSSSNADVAVIDATTGVITIKGAGETTITASAAKVPGSYTAGEQSAKLTVAVKEVGLAWSGCDGLVYDGNAKDVTAKATGLVGNDAVTVTVTGGNAVNAGEYTATASALEGSAAGNYKLPVSVTKAYTIEKADYNVTLSADTVSVKEGTESTAFLPTVSVKGVSSEQPAGELKFYSDAAHSKELTAADVKAFATGDHTVYWSFKTSDANYKDAAKTGSIVIKVVSGDPQNIAISGLDGKTYGDAAFTAVATVTTTGGVVADDHGDITWSSSNTNVAEIDATTGVITIKGAGEATITAKAAKVAGKYAAGEGSARLTAAKKTLVVESINAETKVYDATKSAKLTVTLGGVVSGDNVTATAEGEFNDAAAGTDKLVNITSIKLDEASAANYVLPDVFPAAKGDITKIAAGDIKIEISGLDQTTDKISKPDVKITPEDASAEVKIFIKKTEKDPTTGETTETKVEWTDATAPTGAGTYDIVAEITSANIEGIASKDAKLTVTQKSSGGGGGGGGGAAVTTYKVNIDSTANGTVKANVSSAEKGKTVIVTATPADGYETTAVRVTDASGKAVDVTKNSDGTYKFTMPGSNVTVSAQFTKKSADADTVCAAMKDIDTGAWYHESVHYALEKSIMNGYSSDTFGPGRTLSRAMLAQILYNNAGKPAVTNAASYSDVKAGDWFAAAVSWASANGIVTGYEDGTFRPNADITREQLAAMLYRYAGRPAAEGSLSGFIDADSVSEYAKPAMQWATAAGIITGNGSATVLDPQGKATRAQAAAMIMRYLEKIR